MIENMEKQLMTATRSEIEYSYVELGKKLRESNFSKL